jgi:hypothetical protein
MFASLALKLNKDVKEELLQDKRIDPVEFENFYEYQEKQVQYNSRRLKNYDDSDSEGETDNMEKKCGRIEFKDTSGKVYTIEDNHKFEAYKDSFKNLLKQNRILTDFPIVSMMISYDSKRFITVTKESD